MSKKASDVSKKLVLREDQEEIVFNFSDKVACKIHKKTMRLLVCNFQR